MGCHQMRVISASHCFLAMNSYSHFLSTEQVWAFPFVKSHLWHRGDQTENSACFTLTAVMYPRDLHRAEPLWLQPRLHILRCGVISDIDNWHALPRHVELLLGRTAPNGQSVNELILHLLHLGFPSWAPTWNRLFWKTPNVTLQNPNAIHPWSPTGFISRVLAIFPHFHPHPE